MTIYRRFKKRMFYTAQLFRNSIKTRQKSKYAVLEGSLLFLPYIVLLVFMLIFWQPHPGGLNPRPEAQTLEKKGGLALRQHYSTPLLNPGGFFVFGHKEFQKLLNFYPLYIVLKNRNQPQYIVAIFCFCGSSFLFFYYYIIGHNEKIKRLRRKPGGNDYGIKRSWLHVW